MKQFRVKPYSEPRKTLSPAQQAASNRSFLIFRLRGLWNLAFILTENSRFVVQAAIDADLVGLGAEPQAIRHERERAEFDARLSRRDETINEEELPW